MGRGRHPADRDETATFQAEALAYLDSLYRTALRLTRVPADAEDLVQDTYLKAFRAANRFEPGTNLKAWLFTILHNTALNRFRDRSRQPLVYDSDTVDRAADASSNLRDGRFAETPETLLLAETLDPDLKAAVDALPDAFRQAVWLRDVEEFSYSEIARMLTIPVGTVMSRISRGRRLLFDRLTAARAVAVSDRPRAASGGIP
jgi:RNA polymerase sigma-70 factor (ECF subfamily)